jgi:hypothetical protein
VKSNQVLRSKSLQLTLIWQHDRWRHEIAGVAAEHIVWRSREGTSEDLWPPSPALQDLHVVAGANGNSTALLVGSTSVAHWSVSMEADAENDQLKFDLACRLKSAEGRLGNAYDSVRSCDKVSSTDLVVEPISLSEGVPSCRVQSDALGVSIVASDRNSIVPRTVRWTYVIRSRATADVRL